jgi:hypothetical protein
MGRVEDSFGFVKDTLSHQLMVKFGEGSVAAAGRTSAAAMQVARLQCISLLLCFPDLPLLFPVHQASGTPNLRQASLIWRPAPSLLSSSARRW